MLVTGEVICYGRVLGNGKRFCQAGEERDGKGSYR